MSAEQQALGQDFRTKAEEWKHKRVFHSMLGFTKETKRASKDIIFLETVAPKVDQIDGSIKIGIPNISNCSPKKYNS